MKKKILKIIRRINGTELLQQMINENKKSLDELKWANIFNSTISGSEWLTKKSLSPGRWAARYPFLYVLYRVLDDINPNSILEFGLGESSKITYQFIANKKKDSSLKIIENNTDFASFFYKHYYNLASFVTILPLKKILVKNFECLVYDNLIASLEDKKFDLVIVDGPWGSKRYSRYQIIDIVDNNMLSENFVIIFDDTDRPGEYDTLNDLKALLKAKNISYVLNTFSGEKETTIICSEKFFFLTTI